jgi:hypothetical protein
MKIDMTDKLLKQIKNSAAGKVPKALAHIGKDIQTSVGRGLSKVAKSGNSLSNNSQMKAQLDKKMREQSARNWINSQKKK